MGRLLRAAALGILLTLVLGLLARPEAIAPGGVVVRSPATLLEMKQGTARQPFVRRQLVPFVLRAVDSATSERWRASVAERLEVERVVRPFLFDVAEGGSFDSVVCLIVWFACFTIYVATFESMVAYYADGPMIDSGKLLSFPFLFTTFSCLMLVALLHNNYIYDPVTLCLAVLTLWALERESLWGLVLLTMLFSANRETAFVVPGLTFFTWVHRGRISRAFWQGALLSILYLAIAGSIAYHYRHNPGSAAENNRIYLIHTYLHKNAKYAVAAILSFMLYTVAVIRCWKLLPPALKAVQWFVPLWVAMHILWGWPMEWRVFFEIYPGMMLTIAAMWMRWRRSQDSTLHARPLASMSGVSLL